MAENEVKFYFIKLVTNASLSIGAHLVTHTSVTRTHVLLVRTEAWTVRHPQEVMTAHKVTKSTGSKDPQSSQGCAQYLWNDKSSLKFRQQTKFNPIKQISWDLEQLHSSTSYQGRSLGEPKNVLVSKPENGASNFLRALPPQFPDQRIQPYAFFLFLLSNQTSL